LYDYFWVLNINNIVTPELKWISIAYSIFANR